jgi:multidrug resistance efflux pump
VAQLSVSDAATVTFDALPDLAVEGELVSIAPKSNDGSGVNYKITVSLDDVPEQLRWGMTAFVDVEIAE